MSASNASTKSASRVFVGKCTEGNCSWRMEHGDEAYLERMAGRHEGAEDLTHRVEVGVKDDE